MTYEYNKVFFINVDDMASSLMAWFKSTFISVSQFNKMRLSSLNCDIVDLNRDLIILTFENVRSAAADVTGMVYNAL